MSIVERYVKPGHTANKVEFITVDFVALAPYTLVTKSKGRSTLGQQS